MVLRVREAVTSVFREHSAAEIIWLLSFQFTRRFSARIVEVVEELLA